MWGIGRKKSILILLIENGMLNVCDLTVYIHHLFMEFKSIYVISLSFSKTIWMNVEANVACIRRLNLLFQCTTTDSFFYNLLILSDQKKLWLDDYGT